MIIYQNSIENIEKTLLRLRNLKDGFFLRKFFHKSQKNMLYVIFDFMMKIADPHPQVPQTNNTQ